MNNKIKMVLLFVLFALSLAAIVIAFQLNSINKSLQDQMATKEEQFNREKQSLGQQLSSTIEAKKKLDLQFEELQGKFDTLSQDQEALKSKFDLVTKERASMVERLTALGQEKTQLEQELMKLKDEAAKQKETSGGFMVSTAGVAPSTDDAYWANIMKEKASLSIQIQNLESELANLKLKYEKSLEEGHKLELQIKTLTDGKGDLERRFVYTDKLAETLSEDLVREKRDKKVMMDQMDRMRSENLELKNRLVALGDKKTTLEGRLMGLQEEREVLSKRLTELDQVLQDRVDDILQVKDELKTVRAADSAQTAKDGKVVQLQPIVVKAADSSGPSSSKPAGISGQILAVNEENNFAIIDLGEDDGIKVGQPFSVMRNNERVGTVEVIQLRKEISAVDMKVLSPGMKLKIGDTVL